MAEPELSVWLRLKDEASAQLKVVAGNMKSTADSLRPLGVIAVAAGASMTGMVMASVKAANEQMVSQMRLASMLKNIGVSYNDVKSSIEKVIQVTMSKTGVSDEDQRNALVQLLLVMDNYELALKALPAVLDLAAVSGMSLENAAKLVAKAISGDNDALTALGITIPAGATAEEALAIILEEIGGSAEGAKDPLSAIATSIREILTALGTTVLGDLATLSENIADITTNIIDWIEQNPELTRTLVLVTLAVGTFLTLIGAVILAAPGVVAAGALMGSGFLAALGPIGLIILAIMAVIAFIALVVVEFEWFKEKFMTISKVITDVVRNMLNIAIDNINTLIGVINWLIDKVKSLPLAVKVLFPALGLLSLIPEIPTIPNIAPPENYVPFGGANTATQTSAPINITVNGWVGSDQDIADKIREIFVLQGQRNANTALGGYA